MRHCVISAPATAAHTRSAAIIARFVALMAPGFTALVPTGFATFTTGFAAAGVATARAAP
jgi:hypothetical protein